MKTTLISLILGASAFAQLQPKEFIRVGAEPVGIENVLGGAVKGAPYSATVVTESIQTLADGNRISKKQSTFAARDSQGRMRMEVVFSNVPGLSAEHAPRLVMIHDPVAQESFTFDLNRKIAVKRKLGVENPEARAKMKSEMEMKIEAAKKSTAANRGAEHRESLGFKVVEGVPAEGFRTVRTIAAGEIGNEKPIEIISETWTSTELHAVVYSKRSDPRTGDQIMTLTNIQRTEPAASLFTVPADFKETRDNFQFKVKEKE